MSKKPIAPINTATAGWNNPFGKLSSEKLPSVDSPAPSISPQSVPARLGRVVLRRETAHRGGKSVIVVHDFPAQFSAARIEELASRLKKACGCGGTTKDRTIEIQGDQPARIRSVLEAEGFRVAGVR